jgi:hypothetical protein
MLADKALWKKRRSLQKNIQFRIQTLSIPIFISCRCLECVCRGSNLMWLLHLICYATKLFSKVFHILAAGSISCLLKTPHNSTAHLSSRADGKRQAHKKTRIISPQAAKCEPLKVLMDLYKQFN